MSSSSYSHPGFKGEVELPFRTIRIGSLRTFPYKSKPNEPSADDEPALISEKGLKLPFSFKPDITEKHVFKISARHIQCVEAYMSRGCPVFWIKPSRIWAEKIRDVCGMSSKMGPYIDPDSESVEEHEIAIIPAQDPLPFAVVHSLKHIFYNIAKKQGIKPEIFFTTINQKDNNDKLVKCTVYIEKMEHHRHYTQLVSKSKKHKKRSTSSSESNTSDFSDSDADSLARKNKTQNNEQKSAEHRKEERRKEAEKKDASAERQRDPVQNKVSAPSTSALSTGAPPKKVHRARKSIPNRHRVVSIESQLRARIEQSPKGVLIKTEPDERTSNAQKRKNSDESDLSDTSWRPSDLDHASSPDIPQLKKKKTKDSGLPSMMKKKKKKLDISTRSSSPTNQSSTEVLPQVNGVTSIASASTEDSTATPSNSTKLADRKAQALTMHMRMLRQDHENMMKMTPLCTCVVKSPHSLKLSSTEKAKCMAIDHIDGRLYGCYNDIRQPEMFRPSNKTPVLGLCDEHRERMIRHESCPGCGTFCVGGAFLVCIKNPECPHRFHRDCMILSGRHGDCPHCGGDLTDVKEVNLRPGNDSDLMWILAGHVPERMRRKQYVNERGKSARMGHRPAIQLVPEKVPGITETLPSGVTIDLTTLAPGSDRKKLEEMLSTLKLETSRKNRFQPKVFMQSVNDNDTAKVLQFLGEGFDHSQHRSVLDAAFHESIPNKDLSIIHLLVQAGADINRRYDNGDTPLFRALSKRNKKLIFHLLINNADISILDEDGLTVLHRAAMTGYIDGCHLLVTYGKANINSRSEGGYTPIMWAAEYKQTAMAKYLARLGADLSMIDNEGNICLHWAALSGDVDVVLACLQRNSNPNHANIHGDTPLHVAAREGHHNCISLLLSYGADSTLKNNEKDTALNCTPEQNTVWMMLKVNEWIRKAGLINNRVLPLNRERILSQDMSRGYEKVPVMCVNAVDNSPCPTATPSGFHYVTENVHTSPDTRINRQISSIQSCSCTDGCTTMSCNCGIISECCWYTSEGTLLPNFDITEPPLIFECNQMCKCATTCRNRVIQNGIKYRLQVYRSVGMGWGVRALETIPRGAFVCDYVGELITDAEADVREDDSYLFDLENKDGEMYCIDARNYGNVSRFINHLCEPNLIPIRVFVDHHDVRFPKLAYFTTREIKEYEELGFDYGDRFWDVKCRQFTCQCGSINCKYSAEVYRKKAAKEAEEKKSENGGSEQNEDK